MITNSLFKDFTNTINRCITLWSGRYGLCVDFVLSLIMNSKYVSLRTESIILIQDISSIIAIFVSNIGILKLLIYVFKICSYFIGLPTKANVTLGQVLMYSYACIWEETKFALSYKPIRVIHVSLEILFFIFYVPWPFRTKKDHDSPKLPILCNSK